jgi:hypothetical protein
VAPVAERKHVEPLILAQSQIPSCQVDPAQVVDAVQGKTATACAFDLNEIEIEFRQHLSCRKLASILFGLRVAA